MRNDKKGISVGLMINIYIKYFFKEMQLQSLLQK